jgi:hypothetical protein
MPEENQGAQETPPSPLEAAIASSPEALEEQAQETQTPPAQEGVTQEPVEAKIPYSRLKEVVDEKNWYKQQMERMLQQQQSQQQFQQPTQQPPQELGNTPEEREFWRMQRQIAKEEAEKVFGKVTPVIDAGRMELAQMKVQQFRAQHPDIKANSSEEIAIAEKIQMGYLPEDAYRSIMWESKVAETEKQTNQSIKQKMEAKKQANVEQRSIPAGAVPPTKEKLTLRQRIERAAEGMDLT